MLNQRKTECFAGKIRNKATIPTSKIPIHIKLKSSKKNNFHTCRKKENFLFMDKMVLYIKNPRVHKQFYKPQDTWRIYKKSIDFLYYRNDY